jgi:hypothetical protein
MKTIYIGDGVYASFDGYYFTLTTGTPTNTKDKIYLEPDILESFLNFVKTCKGDNEDEN